MENIKFAIDYLTKNSYKMLGDNNNYATQSVNLAIEALEKQIPIKPISEAGRYTGHYLCPNCNRIYWKDKLIPNYCQSCGQKFDL